jgi:hypothetical protein
MPDTYTDAAVQIGERLRGRVGETLIEGVALTITIGVAMSRPDGEEELEGTLQRADAALYEGKKVGGNRVLARSSRLPFSPPATPPAATVMIMLTLWPTSSEFCNLPVRIKYSTQRRLGGST